jgi:hypothetical protein
LARPITALKDQRVAAINKVRGHDSNYKGGKHFHVDWPDPKRPQLEV